MEDFKNGAAKTFLQNLYLSLFTGYGFTWENYDTGRELELTLGIIYLLRQDEDKQHSPLTRSRKR